MPQTYVTLDFDQVVIRGPLSMLIDFGDQKTWVPLSVIEEDPEDDDSTVTVREWFALKEGLI
jgi:hypothetical protein